MFFVMEAFFMMLVNSNLKVRVDQSAAKPSKEILDEYHKRKEEVDSWSEVRTLNQQILSHILSHILN